MKKILKTIMAAALIISCAKKAETNVEKTSNQQETIQKANEMTALMDKMMDEMHNEKPTGNNDTDFAKMMEIHHKGAIYMSELLLEKGKSEKLKNFAKKIIADQNQEITLMKKYDDAKEISPDDKVFQRELNQSMAAMMNKDLTIHNDIDRDYAEQMIPHHQSAVDMAKVYLQFGKKAELLQLCRNIMRAQNQEILELKQWLSTNLTPETK